MTRLEPDGAIVFADGPHQRRGIGSAILARLLTRCDEAGIRDVLLFAARGAAGFYERFGFVPRGGDVPGMIRRTPR